MTEINSRPLNLFFKDTEIQDRLNSVGKDISLLVRNLLPKKLNYVIKQNYFVGSTIRSCNEAKKATQIIKKL